MNKFDFICTIAPVIQKEARKRGYKYPSAIIAQACLESSWGNSVLSSAYHNYFGMKCGRYWNGKSVNMHTREEYNGNSVYISDNFRVYESIEKGIAGYFDFINTSRYENLKTASSSSDYIQKIKMDGWATASNYVNVLKSIVTDNHLEEFDITEIKEKKKSVSAIAKEVIEGKWSNGAERKERLEAAGYNYEKVQKKVNGLLK